MKKQHVVAGIFFLIAALIIRHQLVSRVIAERASPSGECRVVVREIQLHPFSLTSILRANQMVYRCEYYPHPGWLCLRHKRSQKIVMLQAGQKSSGEMSLWRGLSLTTQLSLNVFQGQWQRMR